ncbi:MAG: M28 family peptidase [Sporomusaceae bacterium]|nr:M28 family peptidase [Sporomusaceae bacterium]
MPAIDCQALLDRIRLAEMQRLLSRFSALHRLTGQPAAEQAGRYIIEQLTAYGIDCELYEFDGYFSDPLSGELRAGKPAARIDAKPRSFSANCPEGISGTVIYDRHSRSRLTPLEEDAWFRQFQGKVVLSWNFYEDYVKKIEAYGAIGLIHIWGSGEEALHEETVGPVWGTPTPDSIGWLPAIPVLGIRQADGLRLIRQAEAGDLPVTLRSRVENHVAKAFLPVARIAGKTDEYVLVSGHYDSWHEGVTDNAVGNAVCLELARIFAAYAGKLERGVRIAWWPGHSNGRYMGSAWFCDNQWQDLNRHCIGHLNIDSPGSCGGTTVLPRTSRLEGDSLLPELIGALTGLTPQQLLDIPRGADQSFWGVDIPFHMMFKYQPPPDQQLYQSPGSGGGWWWHTEHDTIDKVDDELLLRDARLNAATVFALAAPKRLPADFGAYFAWLETRLRELAGEADPAFDFQPILAGLTALSRQISLLADTVDDTRFNRLVKRAGGRLHGLVYSAGSRYDFDNAFPAKPFPSLQRVALLRRDQTPAAQFLFARTAFIRQRNRLIHEMNALSAELTALLS